MKNKKIWIVIVAIIVCILAGIFVMFWTKKDEPKPNTGNSEQTTIDTSSEQETEPSSEEIKQPETETEQADKETQTPSEETQNPSQETEQPDKPNENPENNNTQNQTPQTGNTEEKVIYLTFDDGPGPYTQRLLDILDEYGIKVTFFVTNCQPKYQHMIGEAYRRGHTIALHTYNHYYSNYSSEEVFYQDLKLINDIVVEQTGVTPTIMRFPGGSSNTKSKQYCEGIMTTLTQGIESHGYKYCDWNVSSGDAGETTSTQQVVTNVINGIQKNNVSTVLQHDIKDFSVNAVEQIIQWGKANGYTFLPLTETSPMHHHAVNN